MVMQMISPTAMLKEICGCIKLLSSIRGIMLACRPSFWEKSENTPLLHASPCRTKYDILYGHNDTCASIVLGSLDARIAKVWFGSGRAMGFGSTC